MGDTINEYAGQIKTARTEGLLTIIVKWYSRPNYSAVSVTMACRFRLDHSSRALLQSNFLFFVSSFKT